MNRRDFVKSAAFVAALENINLEKIIFPMENKLRVLQVTCTDSNFEREKLSKPLGFKGGYLTELWQTAVKMESESKNPKIGIATQSVLYGDSELFSSFSEAGGNALMFGLTCKALQLVGQTPFTTPIELLEKIFPEVVEEGIKITGKHDLNENFVYNALVSIDHAAWLLYAAENKLRDFDAMIPLPFRKALSHHNEKIAVMFAISYNMSLEEIREGVKQGFFVFKIKTGYSGTQAEMLEQDKARLTQIHNCLKDVRTNQTANGKVVYTMDANGRYEKKETLLQYLDHAKKVGAFNQILLYEEPFNHHNNEDVTDIGITIAADESLHDEASALRRLEQGYGAFVLKGIAKTFSLSMKLAKLAHEKKVPCLCADLTVNPILVNWHKNLASRLAPFPGLGMGIMETNGSNNYKNWETMSRYNPGFGASWAEIQDGVFELNKDFYDRSGGILDPSSHYQAMFKKP